MPPSSPDPSPLTPAKESQIATLHRLRKISHLLDNAIPIPGTPYRIGLDPILGLLPAGGDIAGALLSGYIIYSAAQLGVPRETLVRMVSNILIEVFAGIVPVIGDLIDVTWKANVRNIALLEDHMQVPEPSKKADRAFVFLLLGGLLLVVVAVAAFSVLLITLVVRAIAGG